MKQIVIPGVPLAVPADAKSRWWSLGAFDDQGRSCFQARLVFGPTMAAHVPYAVRQFARFPHVVVTTGAPDHETVYEVSHGMVVVNRLSEFT